MSKYDIDITERLVSTGVFKGKNIGEHEYFLEFDVTVQEAGCYAIMITLYDHDSLTGNETVARMTDARIPCFCFEKGKSRKFYVTGAGAAPKGSTMPPNSSGTRLPGLTGSWPKSDGWFDDTIELFAKIELFQCSKGKCEGDKKCSPKNVRSLGEPVNWWRTYRSDVDIEDGEGVDEGIDLLKEGAGAGVSLGTSLARSERPSEINNPVQAGLSTDYELALARLEQVLRSRNQGMDQGNLAPENS